MDIRKGVTGGQSDLADVEDKKIEDILMEQVLIFGRY
jgi:hypothetical protein